MNNDEKLASLKQQTVAFLVGIAPRGWKRLFCDYEWHSEPAGFTGNESIIAVIKTLFRPAQVVNLDSAADVRISTSLIEIAKLTVLASGKNQGIIDVIVKDATNHDWHIVFAPPPRITAMNSGDFDALERNPELSKPWRKFATRDEWLAKVS